MHCSLCAIQLHVRLLFLLIESFLFLFIREENAPVEVAAPAPAPTPVLGEPMDLMTALQLVMKKSVAHDGLVKGLREAAKAIEKHAAQICVLAEDCDQPDYVKLVKALCAEHNVHLVTVPSAKTLGEWAGLCKIDSEGKARKVVGCSCVVVKVMIRLRCSRRIGGSQRSAGIRQLALRRAAPSIIWMSKDAAI
uniref:Uncharacterized protein n=1 Tax=Avena sativa TaxID=4498 RepID=A0ACD5WCI9_AVESA